MNRNKGIKLSTIVFWLLIGIVCFAWYNDDRPEDINVAAGSSGSGYETETVCEDPGDADYDTDSRDSDDYWSADDDYSPDHDGYLGPDEYDDPVYDESDEMDTSDDYLPDYDEYDDTESSDDYLPDYNEYDDTESSDDYLPDYDEYDNTAISDDYLPDYDEYGSDSAFCAAERDPNVPEGTYVVRYENDDDKLMRDMGAALEALEPEVCLIGDGSFDRDDMYDKMPYSAFWLTDYSTSTQTNTDPATGAQATYKFYHFNYNCSSIEEVEAGKAEIDTATDSIIAKIPAGSDEWGKILSVHDSLCKLVTYDKSFTEPHIYDIYGALGGNHIAVCNGYSLAMVHILKQLGIEAERVCSDDYKHAWNKVSVASSECFLDVTWDDLNLVSETGVPLISHDYFFLTKEEMSSVPDHMSSSYETDYTMYYSSDYNYHKRNGYMIDSYSWDDLVSKLKAQYDSGSAFISVRFANEGDYEYVKQWMDSGRSELNDLVAAIGYNGYYYYWYNDNTKTFSVHTGQYSEVQ